MRTRTHQRFDAHARAVRNFRDPATASERAADAARERRTDPCQTRGCPFKGTLDSPWCAQHRDKKPESMDALDPKIPGRCNWPSKTRRRSRCKLLAGKCSAHPRTEPPL